MGVIASSRVAAKKPDRRLRLEFSGNLIKHLGLLMYGGPVPALAELIANAWDADAKKVELSLPLGRQILPTDVITIKDYGRGMTWEEVANRYLVIGRNRRSDQPEKTALGRHVMGRKGIGKLAGFGIARVVEIRTVRNKWLTHFSMDFSDMVSDSAAHARYEPDIIADEPSSEINSTTVILRHLSLKRAIPTENFRESLARRFAVFDANFAVQINGKVIKKSEMETVLRFPEERGALATEFVDGFGPVQYWYGFTRTPIPESDARGMSIIVRGRMARPPSMFDISGGVWNQQDLEYLTGEVIADGLDDNEDFVSTDRQSVNWTEDGPAALRTWGQKLIRHAVREYDSEKTNVRRLEALAVVDQLEAKGIDERLRGLPPHIRSTADRLIGMFAKSDDQSRSPEKFADALHMVVQLSEDAAGGTSHEGSALLHSLVEARRSAMMGLSTKSPSALYSVLRDNPWIIVSPWRVVIEDTATTAVVGRLKKSRSQLGELRIWVVQHESKRYLVAFGSDNARSRSQLLALSRDVLSSASSIKALEVILITPDEPTGKTAGIKTVSIRRLVDKASASCETLLDLLTLT